MKAQLARSDRRPHHRALLIVLLGFALEVVAILPVVDRFAESHPTFHFTQHGLIFLGGIVMGVAVHDLWGRSRR